MGLYTLTVDLLMKTGSFERDAGKAARQFDQRMQAVEASAKRAGTAIGLAISGGLIAGSTAVVAWSKDVARLSIEYDRLATLSGTSSENFQRMAAGAETVGISHEKLADILKDVQDKIGDYVQTGGGAIADFFDNIAKRTGVTVEQFRKLSGPDALGLYFKNLEKANLSQSEMTFYMEAIASDSAMLMPLLRDNSTGFKRWGETAQAAGAIIGGDAVEATKGLRDATVEANLALQGIKNSVAEQTLPAFQSLTAMLRSDETRSAFGAISGWVADITIELISGATQFGTWLNRVRELKALTDGGSTSDASTAGLNEQLGKVASERRRLEEWDPWTDKQKTHRASEIKRLTEQQTALQRAITSRIAGENVFLLENGASLPESALKQNRLEYRPTGNINKAANDTAAAEAKKRAEEMARYRKEADLAAATMSGPLDEAMAKHLQNLGEYGAEVSKGNMAQADANVLMAQSAQEYAKVAQEVEAAIFGPEALVATMGAENAMLGQLGETRELHRRQMMNERDMREELAKAVEAAGGKEALAIAKGAASYEAYEKTMLDAADAGAAVSLQMEEAAANAEDWANVAVDAAGGVSDALADLFSDQLGSAGDFFDDLKDVFKQGWRDIIRTSLQQDFVQPFQKAVLSAMSGQGFGLAGMNLGSVGSSIASGFLGQLSGGGAGSGLSSIVGRIAGLGSTTSGLTGAAGSVAGFGNNTSGFATGNLGQLAGLGGGSANSMMPLFGALSGGLYGLKQGSGGISSLLAGAAYGGLGYVGGSLAIGALGGATSAAAATAGAGLYTGASAAAGGAAAGAGAAATAIPVVGWTLAAAALIDAVSGGKLFGTKYKTDSSQQTVSISGSGGDVTATAQQSRQRALFGGKKRRTITVDPSAESEAAADDLFDAMSAFSKSLGVTLQQEAAGLVAGSFTQTYDKKGNVKTQTSSVLGTTYTEDMEAFSARLGAEQVIAAVGKIDSQAGAIAQDWRASADELKEGADFFMTAATDARSGMDLWTGMGLGALTDFVEKMQAADEEMQATYSRLAGVAQNYGTLMADIQTQLVTDDLSSYQQQALTIERTYRQQVKSANDYAKALGLSGARAEDLAKIEALRAQSMAALQKQLEEDKKSITYGLAVSDLSPLTDAEKLDEAMRTLEQAVASGDSSAASSAANTALGFGRNLYASGKDYNNLFTQVVSLIDSMRVGDLDLDDGTTMGDLAEAIEALPESFARDVFQLAAGGQATQTETTAAVQQSNALLTDVRTLLEQISSSTSKTAGVTSSSALRASLNR